MHLEVPEWMLKRNSPKVAEVGLENTGEGSLQYARECLDLPSYEDVSILDIGCGIRFSATFINRQIPVRRYTGVELVKPLVDYLVENVADKDERFRYAYWDVHNARYNKTGTLMAEFDQFPVEGDFDVIWAWSVFTHLNPDDSGNMLRIARNHAGDSTRLFFSAFIDDAVDDFEDRDPVNTLTYAYYSRSFMESLIRKAGWQVDSFHLPNPAGWVQSVFVCSPG